MPSSEASSIYRRRFMRSSPAQAMGVMELQVSPPWVFTLGSLLHHGTGKATRSVSMLQKLRFIMHTSICFDLDQAARGAAKRNTGVRLFSFLFLGSEQHEGVPRD